MNNLKLTKEEKNNINLIEKRVSSTGVIYKEDIGDMKKEIEHSSSKSTMEDLYKICKNHGIYMGNRNGEIIFLSSFFLLVLLSCSFSLPVLGNQLLLLSDAVDWFLTPTARRFLKAPNHSLFVTLLIS